MSAPEGPGGGPGEGPGRPSVSVGRLILGGLLLVLGVGWLLDGLEVDVPWEAALPALLIAVGVALLLTRNAERGAHGGLIAVGIVLTVVLLIGASVGFPLSGGIGERRERPVAPGDVPSRYGLAIGSMTVDLRRLTEPGEIEVEARVGIGELVVLVPVDAAFRVRAGSGIGQVTISDADEDVRDEGSGLDVERTYTTADFDGSTARFDLVVSTGIGSVEVVG